MRWKPPSMLILFLQLPANQSWTVDGRSADLPSGIDFVQLRTESNTTNRKLVVVR